MPIADYVWKPDIGCYIKIVNNSGPYTFETAVPAGAWTQLASGVWMRADGSGPYSRDVLTDTNLPLFPVGS